MIFGEFFPNPGGKPFTDEIRLTVSHQAAFFIEFVGTAILMVVILGATNPRNASRPQILTAVTIGLTVTILISLLGPLTMAAFNPARDLAPRIFSALAGWGSVPFSANGLGWLTVYVIAPVLGALGGGGLYRWAFAPHYAAASSWTGVTAAGASNEVEAKRRCARDLSEAPRQPEIAPGCVVFGHENQGTLDAAAAQSDNTFIHEPFAETLPTVVGVHGEMIDETTTSIVTA